MDVRFLVLVLCTIKTQKKSHTTYATLIRFSSKTTFDY